MKISTKPEILEKVYQNCLLMEKLDKKNGKAGNKLGTPPLTFTHASVAPWRRLLVCAASVRRLPERVVVVRARTPPWRA